MYFLFFILVTLSFCTSVLWPFIYNIHYTFISHLYIWWCMLLFTYLSHALFLLSLYTHVFLLYAILYFCFILRCLDEFCLKRFKKTSCQNLSCHELSSCKVFRIRFYCTQQVIMSLVIYDFSHTSFVCCGFVTDFQRGRLLGHRWNWLEHMLCKID